MKQRSKAKQKKRKEPNDELTYDVWCVFEYCIYIFKSNKSKPKANFQIEKNQFKLEEERKR